MMTFPALKPLFPALLALGLWPRFLCADVTPAAPALEPVTLAPNRPELDLPLCAPGTHLVMAHYMTEFLNYRGNYDGAFMRRDLYDPDGISSRLGGANLFKSIPASLPAFSDLSMEDAAAFEMETALKLGVDGFQFYFPEVLDAGFNRKYCDIVKAFFRAADAKHLDFKLTLCLSNPFQGDEAQKLAVWTRDLKDILAQSRDSDKWLRTPDGRYVIYLYNQDAFSDAVPFVHRVAECPELVKTVAESYERLDRACGIHSAYVYIIHHPDHEQYLHWTDQTRAYLDAVLDYFPAVWGWINPEPDLSAPTWDAIAARCHERHRTYTQTTFSDYSCSKLYDTAGGGWRLIYNLQELLRTPMQEVNRELMPTQLSYVYRRLWEQAIARGVPLVNHATWNDYPEGHQLAPEINHNFAFPLLMRHYKQVWKGDPAPEKEAAAVFFKKYAHTVKANYFPLAYSFQLFAENEPKDDFVDVETILTEPATLYFKGRKIGIVGAGLQSTMIPTEPGQVAIQLKRKGKPFLKLTAPEWITDAPYRTDRGTFCYSSDENEMYKSIFGDAPILASDEYAQGKDGVPNWKKRYKFWKTMTPQP
jgi:hypothetical protein